MTITSEALLHVGASAIVAVLMRPVDSVGTEVQVAIATQAFATAADDTIAPNVAFDGVIKTKPTFGQELNADGQLTGRSEISAGSFMVTVDADTAIAWNALKWSDREIELYVLPPYKMNGDRTTLDDGDLFWAGRIAEIHPTGGLSYDISFAGPRLQLERPLVTKIYRGFGLGFSVGFNPPAKSVHLFADHAANQEITGAMSIEVIGRLSVFPAGGFSQDPMPMLQKGGDTDMNYGLILNSDRTFSFGSQSERIDGSWEIPWGEEFYAGATVASDGKTVKLYGGLVDEIVQVGSGTLAVAIATGTTDPLVQGPVAADGALSSYDLHLWETRLWDNRTLELEEILSLAGGPITDPSDHVGLLEVWRYEEGVPLQETGAIIFGSAGEIDFEWEQDAELTDDQEPAWVVTADGDAPDLFDGSPAGKTRARTYGFPFNVPLVNVDSRNRLWTWDDYLDGQWIGTGLVGPRPWIIRSKGVPMVPPLSWLSNFTAGFEFVAAPTGGPIFASDLAKHTNGRVEMVNPNAGLKDFTFERLVRAQDLPQRPGQRVKISGTVSNNRIYRVAREPRSAESDPAVLHLSGGPVTTESVALGGSIDSIDVQYAESYSTLDPARPGTNDGTGHNQQVTAEGDPPVPGVVLLSDGMGAVTGDVLGRTDSVGDASFSTLFELITGVTPNVDALTFDPQLALFLEPGSSVSTSEVLDLMAKSAFGWWIEDGEGGYRIGNHALPSGSPVFYVDEGLAEIKRDKSIDPVSRFTVGYRRNWTIQDGDKLAGSVSEGEIQAYGEQYSKLPVYDKEVLGDYPNAGDYNLIETLLTNRADAALFAALAKPMLMTKRRWVTMRFNSLVAYSVLPNDVISVTSSDPSLELDETLVRVTGRTIDLSGSMVLRGFH